MKKCFLLLLAMSIILSSSILPVSAGSKTEGMDFNTQSYTANDDYLVFQEYTGNTAFTSGGFNIDASGNAVTESPLLHYEGGIAGRPADDYSEVLRIQGDTSALTTESTSSGATNSRLYCSLVSGSTTVSIHTGRLYEFSAYVAGDVYLQIQDTTATGTIVEGGNRLYNITPDVCNGGWVRVAVWYPAGPVDGQLYRYVYVNGEEAQVTTYTDPNSVAAYRLRLCAWIAAAQADASGIIAIDDYKETMDLDSYDHTAEIPPAFNAYSDKCWYDSDVLYTDGTMTVAELTGSDQTAESVSCKVYDGTMTDLKKPGGEDMMDVSYAREKVGAEVLAPGDVVVFQNNNYENMRYLTVAGSEIEALNFDNQTDVLANDGANTSVTTSYEDALYTKPEGDYAYTVTAVETEFAASASTRRFELARGPLDYTSQNWWEDGYIAPTVTTEFSVALEGDYSKFEVGAMFKYTDPDVVVSADTAADYVNEARAYVPVLSLDKDEFTVPSVDYRLYDKQWVQIALTMHPAEETYDLYVNGEKVSENISTGTFERWTTGSSSDPGKSNQVEAYLTWTGDTTDEWKLVGLNALRANMTMQATEAGAAEHPSASLAIDDVKIYLGDYVSDDQINIDTYQTQNDGSIILNSTNITPSALRDTLSGYEIAVYRDNTYQTMLQDDEAIQTGDVIVITNGLVKRYYTAKTQYMTFYVNDAPSQSLQPGTISAEVVSDTKGTLIMAVYDIVNGEYVIRDIQFASGDTTRTGGIVLENVQDTAVKLMFWDGWENMQPLMESMTIL